MDIVFIVILLLSPLALIVDRIHRDSLGGIRNQHELCYRCGERFTYGIKIPFRKKIKFCSTTCADAELHRDENRLLITMSIVGLIFAVVATHMWIDSYLVALLYAAGAVIILATTYENFKRSKKETAISSKAMYLARLSSRYKLYDNEQSSESYELVEETKQMLEQSNNYEDKIALKRILERHDAFEKFEIKCRRYIESIVNARAYYYQTVMDSRHHVAPNILVSLMLSGALVFFMSKDFAADSPLTLNLLFISSAISGLVILFYIIIIREKSKRMSRMLVEEGDAVDGVAQPTLRIYGAPLTGAYTATAFLVSILACLLMAAGWMMHVNTGDWGLFVMAIPFAAFGIIRILDVVVWYSKVRLFITEDGVVLGNGMHLNWAQIERIDMNFSRLFYRLIFYVKEPVDGRRVCFWRFHIMSFLGMPEGPYFSVKLHMDLGMAWDVEIACGSLRRNYMERLKDRAE